MKKMRTFLVVLITTIALLTVAQAEAKGGFGGRGGGFSSGRSVSVGRSTFSSSRGSSSSSKGSSGIKFSSSKTSSSKPSAPRSIWDSSSGSSSQPRAAQVKVVRDNIVGGLKGKGAKGESAGALYKSFREQSVPRNNPANVAKLNRADIDSIFSSSGRTTRKREYYGNYHPTHSPAYVNSFGSHASSGFGPYDILFFDSIMDNLSDRQWAYHHSEDPYWQQGLSAYQAACNAGDKDICEKLGDLNKEMAEYKAKGVTKNPTYSTPGVDPDVYEANNIDYKSFPEMKICTGSTGSDYGRQATTIGTITKLKVTSVASNGSVDNLNKLASGACGLAFTQHDLAQTSSNIKNIVSPNQVEIGLLVCSNGSKVADAKDLTDKHTIMVGSDQTGSQFTFDNLKKYVPSLAKAKLDTSHSILEANKLLNNTNNCVFAVMPPDSPFFKQMDDMNQSHAVAISDVDFANKDDKKKFRLVNVDQSHYKNLTQEKYKGFFSVGGTDTVAIGTDLVTSQAWIDQNRQLYDLLLLESVNLQKSLQ